MATSTVTPEITRIVQEAQALFALVGNPNVGKSSLFNNLTGLGVVTAHYPGKSVSVNAGITQIGGQTVGVVDLPGIYSFGSANEEQWVVRGALVDLSPDVLVTVVDATNLERNLYLVLQLLDLELPIVVALNLIDEAKRAGVWIDSERLSNLLAVPVVPIQATTGRGVETLMLTALATARGQGAPPAAAPAYGRDVAEHIAELAELVAGSGAEAPGLSPRATAVLILEGDEECRRAILDTAAGTLVRDRRDAIADHLEHEHGESIDTRLARERHGLAGTIASQVRHQSRGTEPWPSRLWRWSIAPFSGIPLLIGVLVFVFSVLFQVGTFLEEVIESSWSAVATPAIAALLGATVGEGFLANVLRWGFDAGILAILSVGIPYVLVFYLMLAFLEDSGYLSSVAFLLDNVMHKFGLHGRSAIPLVAAAGCNVPAIMTVRSLSSMRERVIASTLVVLVPCTARTAVIAGIVGHYAGMTSALALVASVGLIAIIAGLGLNRMLPGTSSGLVMEMFPFRVPEPATVVRKTWYRFHDFVFVALPIVVGGSMLLGVLYETGYIWLAAAPLNWLFEGWLGIPTVAGLCLFFAVLRKELAMQLLVAVAIVQYGPQATNLLEFMSPDQIFVYALVNTIYMPCLATLAVLQRELGTRRTAWIAAATVGLAMVAGGLAIRALALF